MAFEKAKVLKAAEKFLSLGNIAAAVKEYRQITEHDEDDFTALNMLGDLCVRTGNKQEAINCFARIAEHYREQEFTLKAVAMYKKIERLNPRDPEIAEKLASLYSVQGLVVDARAQYMIVAEAHTQAGDAKRALEVLHKIADLDVHNTDVRLKLAEAYLKGGLQAEAAQAFGEAGARLLENRSYEKSLQAYLRVLEIKPHFQSALEGAVKAHIALGTAYEAAELLEKLIAEGTEDPALISLLLTSYLEAQDAMGAERATSMLMAHDASNYTRFLEVARLHLNGGDIDAAARVLSGITERALAGREEVQLLELVNEVLARDPEQIAALRLLVRIHWWQRDTEKLRAALERLTEAAEAAGRSEDERYALTQLVRLVPDERRYVERLRDLGGAQQEEPVDDAVPLPDLNVKEVPTFESFAIVKDGGGESKANSAGGEFVFNSVVTGTEEAEATETISDPSASFADLNEEFESSSGAGEISFGFEHMTAPHASAGGLSDEHEVDFSGALSESSAAGHAATEPAVDDERHAAMLKQELESVDFYISQGYADIALDTLEMLERQYAGNPAIDERRRKLTELHDAAGAPADQTPQPAEEFERFGGGWDVPTPATEPAPSAVLAQPSSNGNAPILARQTIDSGLADIFEEFRVAAEDEEDSPAEDYETHYNMGLAYKEMDLLDEAVREFQAAIGLSMPKDGTPRYLQCCNLLGHCFMQKQLPRAAVIWFRKGLEAPGHSADEYQALRYELASAFEQMGEVNQAIDAFTEVYSVDVAYRDVAEKLQDLQDRKKVRKSRKT
ncbi:MAG: tetratricopeptide repeat protein [Acidobacteriota bacterium]|nr:tetratricopeptide repeat protein [Acidobacteriota bacterium]